MTCKACQDVPDGYVKAKRVRGRGQGTYGVANAGDTVVIPEGDALARPDLWEIVIPEAEHAEPEQADEPELAAVWEFPEEP